MDPLLYEVRNRSWCHRLKRRRKTSANAPAHAVKNRLAAVQLCSNQTRIILQSRAHCRRFRYACGISLEFTGGDGDGRERRRQLVGGACRKRGQ